MGDIRVGVGERTGEVGDIRVEVGERTMVAGDRSQIEGFDRSMAVGTGTGQFPPFFLKKGTPLNFPGALPPQKHLRHWWLSQ